MVANVILEAGDGVAERSIGQERGLGGVCGERGQILVCFVQRQGEDVIELDQSTWGIRGRNPKKNRPCRRASP